jgi:FAD/FMN-containing dehydrogenase
MRVSGFNVAIIAQWTDPKDTDRCTAWCRDTHAALKPFLAPMRYVNYLEDDAGDSTAEVYGSNYPRLRALKAKFDPDNFFHTNVNITPLA